MDRGRSPETDVDALTARFLALSDRLAGTAFFVLGRREDARDAVQEAFVRCWRARDGAREARDLDAWIFAVLLNVAKDQRRRRLVRAAGPLPQEDSMRATAKEPDPAAAMERSDELDRVRGAIHALPEAEREVFLLRQNGELTFEAIGEALGCPVGTAKTRMRAALRRLREAVNGPAGAALVKGRMPCR